MGARTGGRWGSRYARYVSGMYRSENQSCARLHGSSLLFMTLLTVIYPGYVWVCVAYIGGVYSLFGGVYDAIMQRCDHV